MSNPIQQAFASLQYWKRKAINSRGKKHTKYLHLYIIAAQQIYFLTEGEEKPQLILELGL